MSNVEDRWEAKWNLRKHRAIRLSRIWGIAYLVTSLVVLICGIESHYVLGYILLFFLSGVFIIWYLIPELIWQKDLEGPILSAISVFLFFASQSILLSMGYDLRVILPVIALLLIPSTVILPEKVVLYELLFSFVLYALWPLFFISGISSTRHLLNLAVYGVFIVFYLAVKGTWGPVKMEVIGRFREYNPYKPIMSLLENLDTIFLVVDAQRPYPIVWHNKVLFFNSKYANLRGISITSLVPQLETPLQQAKVLKKTVDYYQSDISQNIRFSVKFVDKRWLIPAHFIVAVTKVNSWRPRLRGKFRYILGSILKEESIGYDTIEPFFNELYKNLSYHFEFIKSFSVYNSDSFNLIWCSNNQYGGCKEHLGLLQAAEQRCDIVLDERRMIVLIPMAVGNWCLLENLKFVIVMEFQRGAISVDAAREFAAIFQETFIPEIYFIWKLSKIQTERDFQKEKLRKLIHKIKNFLMPLSSRIENMVRNIPHFPQQDTIEIEYFLKRLTTFIDSVSVELKGDEFYANCINPLQHSKIDIKEYLNRMMEPYKKKLETSGIKFNNSVKFHQTKVKIPERAFRLVLSHMMIYFVENVEMFLLSQHNMEDREHHKKELSITLDGYVHENKIALKFYTHEDIFMNNLVISGDISKTMLSIDINLECINKYLKKCLNGKLDIVHDQKSGTLGFLIKIPLHEQQEG